MLLTLKARARRLLLTRRTIIAALGEGELPANYGVALNERCIEYPWALPKLRGRVLDVGSSLNQGWVLDYVLPRVDELHIVTLAPERRSYNRRSVSYLYGDARELPYRAQCFDTVSCISTLEHIGLDNRRYGADCAGAAAPDEAARQALAEMMRVLRPDGRLLITVPYGRSENFGWMRQFDHAGLRALLGDFADQAEVFRYFRSGWVRSSLSEAADARYRTERHPSDMANAARAVACVAVDAPTLPG